MRQQAFLVEGQYIFGLQEKSYPVIDRLRSQISQLEEQRINHFRLRHS